MNDDVVQARPGRRAAAARTKYTVDEGSEEDAQEDEESEADDFDDDEDDY